MARLPGARSFAKRSASRMGPTWWKRSSSRRAARSCRRSSQAYRLRFRSAPCGSIPYRSRVSSACPACGRSGSSAVVRGVASAAAQRGLRGRGGEDRLSTHWHFAAPQERNRSHPAPGRPCRHGLGWVHPLRRDAPHRRPRSRLLRHGKQSRSRPSGARRGLLRRLSPPRGRRGARARARSGPSSSAWRSRLDVRSIAWEEVREIILALAPDRCGRPRRARASARLERPSRFGVAGRLRLRVIHGARCASSVARARAPREWLTVLGENGLGGSGHTLFTDRRVGHLVRLIRTQPAGLVCILARGNGVRADRGGAKTPPRGRPGAGVLGLGASQATAARASALRQASSAGRGLQPGPVPCGGDCNTVSQAGARPADPTDFTHNMCNLRTVFDLADLGAEPLRPLRRAERQPVVAPPRRPVTAVARGGVDRDRVGAGRRDPRGPRDAAFAARSTK